MQEKLEKWSTQIQSFNILFFFLLGEEEEDEDEDDEDDEDEGDEDDDDGNIWISRHFTLVLCFDKRWRWRRGRFNFR